jgi:Ca2+:H+ antiporter
VCPSLTVRFLHADRNGCACRWFGLILLPIVSFSADGTVAIVFFLRYTLTIFLGKPSPPATLAKARAIDLSIQFTLFWMPFLVLLGWWTNRPLTLLFGGCLFQLGA